MSRLLRVYNLLILIIFFSPKLSLAQEYNLLGTVKSTSGNPIGYVTVTLKLKSSNLALGYATTGNDGKFVIKAKTTHPLTELSLEFNHLGYRKKNIALVDNLFRYEAILEETSTLLDEVEVKSRPKVTQNKDTISYNVKAFAKNEDRSIGDVLKRIPGIEVREDGEIRFNNQPISNFYVDGDDILGGKYGIGTKTIPHNMVKNIQVYSNHEHVKALKNKKSTDKVALNLEINEEAKLKLIGNAKIGIGLPKKYDPELNGILLNKNYKMLNVVKGNNIGEDLTVDALDLFSRAEVESAKTLVGSSTIATPYLPKKRYFNNNSGILNANNFFKFKNELQLKTNFSFLRDKNKIEFNGVTDIYTQNDIVHFVEDQSGYQTSNLNSVTLTAEKNMSNYYFQDEFKFRYNQKNVNSDIFDQQDIFGQHLKDRVSIFSNNLTYIPVFKNNNTLFINWRLTSNKGPQRLMITPGIHPNIINQGIDYQLLDQHSNISVLSNNISATYRINRGKISQSYGIELENNHQDLESTINIIDLVGSYKRYKPQGKINDNALKWRDYAVVGNGLFEYKENKIEASIALPIKLLNINYSDPSFDMKDTKNYLLFNPTVRLNYLINAQDRVILKYSLDNYIADITSLYRGSIFTNYRTLHNNQNNSLAKQRSHNINIDYNIKRPIDMFFANIATNYSIVKRNVLTSTILTENNILQQSNLPYDNQIRSYGLNATVSKYIFALGTTFTLKPVWSNVQLEELINNQIYAVEYNTYEFALNIDFQLFQKISVTQKSNIRYLTNHLSTSGLSYLAQNQSNYNYRQSLNLKYSPTQNFIINIENQSIHVFQKNLSNINVYFLDAGFRLKVPKWKADLELEVTNIMNDRRLTTYSINNTAFVNNSYQLNPRIAMLRAFFYF